MRQVDEQPVWSIVCFVVPFGTRSMFDGAGFSEVARNRPTRPIVRLKLR